MKIPIPPEDRRGWRVEEDLVDAITGTPIQLTDFPPVSRYMGFAEAVAVSAERGEPVDLPLGKDWRLRPPPAPDHSSVSSPLFTPLGCIVPVHSAITQLIAELCDI